MEEAAGRAVAVALKSLLSSLLFLLDTADLDPANCLLQEAIPSLSLQHPTKTIIMSAEKIYNTAFDLVARFKGLKGRVGAQLRGSAEGSKASSAGSHTISS